MPYTRPTTDIAKEGLFNMLQHNLDLDEIKTLDLFGGTGSISYELASRGAKELTIVEKDSTMYEFIKKTAKDLRIENLQVIKMDVFRFINQCAQQFDFIFADAMPGKYDLFDETIAMLNSGGIYIIDDMLPQPNWPLGHDEKVRSFINGLESRNDLLMTKMNWSTGIIIIAKK